MPLLDRLSISPDRGARYSLLGHVTAIYANESKLGTGLAVYAFISARSVETSEQRLSWVISAACFSHLRLMSGISARFSSDRLVTLHIFITLGNHLPCHCEPRLVGAWQSHCEAGACYSWIEGPCLEIASSLSLLAMTKRSVTNHMNEYNLLHFEFFCYNDD